MIFMWKTIYEVFQRLYGCKNYKITKDHITQSLHKATIKRKVRMLSLKLTPKFTLVFMSTTQHMRDADLSLKPKAREKTQLLRILGYMKAKNPFFFFQSLHQRAKTFIV